MRGASARPLAPEDGVGVVAPVGFAGEIVLLGVSVSVSGVVLAPEGMAVVALPEEALGLVAVAPDCLGFFDGELKTK